MERRGHPGINLGNHVIGGGLLAVNLLRNTGAAPNLLGIRE
jgi:hypothetical protein